jgi:hypothetical protein
MDGSGDTVASRRSGVTNQNKSLPDWINRAVKHLLPDLGARGAAAWSASLLTVRSALAVNHPFILFSTLLYIMSHLPFHPQFPYL